MSARTTLAILPLLILTVAGITEARQRPSSRAHAPSDAVQTSSLCEHPLRETQLPVGGRLRDVEVASEDVAYAVHGLTLRAVPLTDVPDNAPKEPVALGSVTFDRLAEEPSEADLTVANGTLFAALHTHGLHSYDLSDPLHPRALDRLAPDVGAFESVVVRDGYAYVGHSYMGTGAGVIHPSGVRVIDVSDPSAMRQVGQMSFRGRSTISLGHVDWIGLHADVLYTSGSDSLYLVDISDPTQPSFEGVLELGMSIDRAEISDGHAFISSGSRLYVRNLSDPFPTGSVAPEGNLHGGMLGGFAISGERVYVPIEDLGSGPELWVVDVSDPRQPTELAREPLSRSFMPRPPYIVDAQAGVLAMASREQIGVLDVSQPAEPIAAGHLSIFSEPNSALDFRDDQLYVGTDTGLFAFDVNTPAAPRKLDSVRTDASSVLRNVLATADGVVVAGGLTQHHTLRSRDGWLRRLSRDKRGKLHPAGELNTGRAPGDLATGQDALLVSERQRDGSSQLAMYRTDGEEPFELAATAEPGGSLAVLGRHALVAHRAGLSVLEIGPSSLELVASVTLDDSLKDVVAGSGHAFVLERRARLRAIDLADPVQPEEVGALEIDGELAALDGRCLLVVKRQLNDITDDGQPRFYGQIHRVDVSDPTAPRVVGTDRTLAPVDGLTVGDGQVFVANWGGLSVLQPDPNAPEPTAVAPPTTTAEPNHHRRYLPWLHQTHTAP